MVRATFLRATLHLTSAADHLALRATIQPVLSAAAEGIMRARSAELDVGEVVATARSCSPTGR